MAKDFLWRDDTASGGADYMGRTVTAGKDYAGRDMWGDSWAAAATVAVGDRIILATGEVLEVTTAGTTDAATAPTAPGYGETVTDGTAVWTQVANS